ncbi:hypothetical protein [Acidicapsa ligni]|uniref:hypothetical protein n=1 Tax=Acidicapsa ligni TaxID=542300 RepID=UPI0021E016AE|nr:hypothetical protein [Acidicapsa ligni]
MDTSSERVPHRPEYRLFDSAAVGTATFICPPAGAILLAINYVRLGKAGRGVLAVVLGLIVVALNILVKLIWKTSSGSLERLEYDAFELLFLGFTWYLTWKIAKEDQGYAISQHAARGGRLGFAGTGFGVGIATLAILVVVAGALLYQYQHRTTVLIGAKDQVIYSGLATRGNALALGNALKSNGYLQERGTSVLLHKGMAATTISFGVQYGVWNQAGILSKFEELTRQVVPTVGGFPVQVQLIDSNGNVQETSNVGEVHFGGKDAVYYEGTVTKAEAMALGKRFQAIGFLRGKGANILWSRHDDDGTILAFVVVREVDAKMVSSFEQIVRDVAPVAGGLPIDMHLVNPQLEVKKDEMIK